jgi:hypothetical protein
MATSRTWTIDVSSELRVHPRCNAVRVVYVVAGLQLYGVLAVVRHAYNAFCSVGCEPVDGESASVEIVVVDGEGG